MSVYIAELVADVTVEEGIDALLSEIGRAIRTAAGTDGDIGKLEAALTIDVSVVFVAALQVAND